MKKDILRAVAITCVALTYATAQESGGFAPVAGANIQAGGTQASVQANANQQVSTPLLLNVAGTAVKDESGQQLGQIQHLIVTPQGCVDMAVLSLGGTKLVPIPWQLVEVNQAAVGTTAAATPGRIALKLNVDRQKLQQAPSFSMNQISQITQQQTMQQVFNFYGVQSHDQTSGVGASATQSSSISGGTSSTNAITPSSTNQFGTQGAAASTATNQFGSRGASTNTMTNQFGSRAASTNQFGSQGAATNAQEQLSPTGRTNGYPNRPGVPNTNNPAARPPFNRPPDNRPPTNTPPGQPLRGVATPSGQ
jgi:hypothetical protein